MKTKLPFLIFLLTLLSLCPQCLSQNVFPHPVPEEFASTQYVVSVNGLPVQVFHAGLNVYFASFDFTVKADIKVTAGRTQGVKSNTGKYVGQTKNEYLNPIEAKDFWVSKAVVKPLSKNLKSQTNGAEVTFSLTEPGQYSVERPGTSNYMDQVLFLFANRPETDHPKAGDANVIYLKPGIHIMDMELKSGQTLYLEAGAVLFGCIDIWDATNVRVLGRGTLVNYGPQSELRDLGYKHLKKWHPITTDNVKGLVVGGITIVGRSRTWIVQLRSTFDVVFDNVKVLGVNAANVNGDGFDLQGVERAKITNSLIRCADDVFAFFPSNPVIYKPEPGQSEVSEYKEVKDVLIENCVIWSTLANLYRLVPGSREFKTDNIVMRNCDVIHIGRGKWWAPWSAICTIDPSKKENSIHTNYLFENIRFEEPVPFLGIQGGRAQFRNVVFRNISMNGAPDSSMFEGKMDGLTFENVKVNGKLVRGKNDVPFEAKASEIKNLIFK